MPDFDGYVFAGSHDANAYDEDDARITVTLAHYRCTRCGATVTTVKQRGRWFTDDEAVRDHDAWHEEQAR